MADGAFLQGEPLPTFMWCVFPQRREATIGAVKWLRSSASTKTNDCSGNDLWFVTPAYVRCVRHGRSVSTYVS